MPSFWNRIRPKTTSAAPKHRRWKRYAFGIPLALAAVLFLIGLLVSAYYSIWALSFDMQRVSRMPATSIIYDRNGYVIQRLYDEHRILIDQNDIPQVLKHAILAKEDARFYWHPGVDPIAVTRSVLINVFSGEVQTGASTITQQLARNSAGMFEVTVDRKLKEMFLALRIELAFSKDEILTFYLNRIFFGGNLYGVGAASDAYFGKHPRDLDLEQSAMLAGIIAAPNAFTPWKNPEKTKTVRNFTLSRMVDQDFITEEEAEAASQQPLTIRPLIDIPGTYITSVVRDMLPTFITEEILFQGGLHIHTTIDLAFQEAATRALQGSLTDLENTKGFPHITRKQYLSKSPDFSKSPPYLQGAFVAISNVDGGILAAVGGRHYDESTFNRALLSRRQIGSTVKPFVYSYAFNVLNATAFTEVDRSPFDLTLAASGMPLAGDKPDFVPIRTALETSNNYATMRLGLASGIEGFSYFMSEVTGTDIAAYPSTFLGACDLTPMELAAAFSIFPNYGVALDPYLIKSISLHNDQLLYERIDERKRVISPQVAFQIQDILSGVVARGTASSLRQKYGFKNGLGGKTGTTNDYKDAWFAGYTSEVTAVVWVGFDQPKPIMPGGFASRVAVPIWANIMKEANQHYGAKEFYPPPGVEKVKRKKEDKVFWFFKTTSAEGTAEFVRDEQRSNALVRLDKDFELVPYEPEDKSVVRRAWDWVFPPQPKDEFMPTGEALPRAEIHDTIETEAPRAEPVGQ